MDAKGANPFLMMGGDDFASAPSNNSNPFLMDGGNFGGSGGDFGGSGGDFGGDGNIFSDNPFLSSAPVQAPANNATNPFAFDPMEYAPAEATPAVFDIPVEPIIQNATITTDFFSIDNNEAPPPQPPPNKIEKPDALDLKHTHTVEPTQFYLSDEELAKTAAPPPRRPPPPPRPVVPPSKETQDLIMSVTGAMDATSSHLLDRIPPTRTPSPVSMRDLHSPSPTPEHAFADFLDVSGGTKAPSNSNAEINLLDVTDTNEQANKPVVNQNVDPFMSLISNDPVCDINQNHSMQQAHANAVPPPVAPHAVPPRPQPPRPPPPPPVRRPSPPKPPQPQPQAPKQQEMDMMDMMGDTDVPSVVEKPIASTADIMSLYATVQAVSKQPEPVVDLLNTENTEPNDTVNTNVQDTIMSPELSQQDMHMDTSDTQSNKESVSSVTFNPFAGDDNVTPIGTDNTSPNKAQNDLFSQSESNQMQNDVFSQSEPINQTSDDIFSQSEVQNDIFSQSETNQVENDIFSQPEVTNDIFSQPEVVNQDIFSQPEIANISMQNQNVFTQPEVSNNIFAQPAPDVTNTNAQNNSFFDQAADVFDDFAAKFESAGKDENKNGAFDPFGGNGGTSAWGSNANEDKGGFATGFEADEPFDAFLTMQEPPAVPQHTPSMLSKRESQESDEDKDFSVFIKPKNDDDLNRPSDIVMPVLAPPPKADIQNAFNDNSPRFNPFDQQNAFVQPAVEQIGAIPSDNQFQRTDSQETPPTPLFDDDVSQPLEDFPRTMWNGPGWEMQLRQPNKKKITGQRFWKKILVKLILHEDCPILQLFNLEKDKDPFQELPLQPCYSVSDIGAQQYDNYGKIFTLKLQYVFYKERPGVRPGQVTKAERLTNKLSQFAAYAIQGDYQGVKEFGSDLKKLGLPVEHAPQVSQLLKLGSLNYEDMKQFSVTIEEALFRLSAHRDRALHYKMEEVQVTAVDELYVEQNAEGFVEKQIARVRLFFLGFLSGMPDVELGVNDMRRQGKEVVGRHDIIPVITEEWIRIENVEFHSCVQQDDYNNTHIIKFKPPDACYIELMRFRIRPPKNRELPLQLKPVMCITGNKVEIRADCLVPGFASRKLGQVPCEDVQIRIPIPECWIYLFRVEKHFRYGSVKSAHRRTGKIKGIERILGTMDALQESLIEVTSGQAKYEHQHRAIVWRIPRLPKEGQGAYTTHNLVCRLALTSYDQVPDQLAEYCYVEFTMPATQASHMTVRSVSLQNSQSDDPPEKYVRYLARHEYRVGIEHTEGEDPNAYAAATAVVSRTPAPVPEEPPAPATVAEESSSDSD